MPLARLVAGLCARGARPARQVLDALLVPYTFRLAQHLPPWAAPEMHVKIGIVGSVSATPPGTKMLLSEIPYQHWVS